MRRALPLLTLPALAVLLAGCLTAPPPAAPPSKPAPPVKVAPPPPPKPATTSTTTTTTTTSTTTTATTTTTTLPPLASVTYQGPAGICSPTLLSQNGTLFDVCQGTLQDSALVRAHHSTGGVCFDPVVGSEFRLFADVELTATQGGTTVELGGTPDQLFGPFHRWDTGLDVRDGPVTVTLRGFALSDTTVCFD